MITVSGVTKQYGKRVAVDGISFDVAPAASPASSGRTARGSRRPRG
jgi:ABC-type multidrug transport system ATPase subunit